MSTASPPSTPNDLLIYLEIVYPNSPLRSTFGPFGNSNHEKALICDRLYALGNERPVHKVTREAIDTALSVDSNAAYLEGLRCLDTAGNEGFRVFFKDEVNAKIGGYLCTRPLDTKLMLYRLQVTDWKPSFLVEQGGSLASVMRKLLDPEGCRGQANDVFETFEMFSAAVVHANEHLDKVKVPGRHVDQVQMVDGVLAGMVTVGQVVWKTAVISEYDVSGRRRVLM